MISESLEVEKQRENETTGGVHARFEPDARNLAFLLAQPQCRGVPEFSLISHLECDENEQKRVFAYRLKNN